MLSQRTLAIGLALAACAVAVAAVLGTRDEQRPKGQPPAATAAATVTPAVVAAPVAASVSAKGAPTSSPPSSAAASGQPGVTTAFDQAMASTDPNARRAAIDRAVKEGDTSVLARLYRVDITVDGYEAAAAIQGVGKLAALLPEADRATAITTLAGWLKQESKRDAPGAMGNALIAIEALADTKARAAVQPLVEALDSASLPLNVETDIVQMLDELDAREAAPSVTRFAARVARRTPENDLEKELCSEATTAANAALGKWRK